MIEYLRKMDMFRGFVFPHRLRVLHNGTIELFDSPSEAKALIERLKKRPVETDSVESVT